MSVLPVCFGAPRDLVLVYTLIAAGTGTAIGTMTNRGGLAAAFDGNLSQSNTACAQSPAATTAYIGKNYSSAPKVIGKATYYGPNNYYIFDGAYYSETVTAYLQGSHNNSSWTTLGTATTPLAGSNAVFTVTSSDTSTQWEYVRVYFDATASGGYPSGQNFHCAELLIYEAAYE